MESMLNLNVGGGGLSINSRKSNCRTVYRRKSLSFRDCKPNSHNIVLCSSSSDHNNLNRHHHQPSLSPSSFLSRLQTYSLLKQRMEVAINSEDYKEAARIRDSLNSLESVHPVLRLRRLSKEAVANERFEDAAKYRDELNQISPHYLTKCSSDTTTLGIRVEASSEYIKGRSNPTQEQYFFSYKIRITNNSDRPIQLVRTHWIITNGDRKTENVWSTGVIGEQPVILPGKSFEYSSACPLTTPNGRLESDFQMKRIESLSSSSTFNVVVASFSLSTLGDTSFDNI
ncbi:hypothetical protein ACFE04_027789 [Oxalis oulophora]